MPTDAKVGATAMSSRPRDTVDTDKNSDSRPRITLEAVIWAGIALVPLVFCARGCTVLLGID